MSLEQAMPMLWISWYLTFSVNYPESFEEYYKNWNLVDSYTLVSAFFSVTKGEYIDISYIPLTKQIVDTIPKSTKYELVKLLQNLPYGWKYRSNEI